MCYKTHTHTCNATSDQQHAVCAEEPRNTTPPTHMYSSATSRQQTPKAAQTKLQHTKKFTLQ